MYTHTSFATRYFSHNVNKFCRIVVYIYIYIVFKNNSLLLWKRSQASFFVVLKPSSFDTTNPYIDARIHRSDYFVIKKSRAGTKIHCAFIYLLRGLYYFSRGDKNSSKAIAILQRYTLSGPVNTLQTAYICNTIIKKWVYITVHYRQKCLTC